MNNTPEGQPDPAQYPAYPPTNHPEDRPGFTGESYEGYSGYDGDTTPGAATGTVGYAGADAELPADGDLPQRPTDGKVKITEAIGWGFKATFRNWSLWIILGLLGFLAIVGLSVLSGVLTGQDAMQAANESAAEVDPAGSRMSNYFTILFSLIVLFLVPLFYNAALWTLRRNKVGWSSLVDNANYGPTLGMQVVVRLVTNVVGILVGLIPVVLLGIALPDLSSIETMDESQLGALLGGVLGAALLVMLVALAIEPLFALWTFVIADRQETFGKAIARGFKAGARNWLPLIGLYVLLGLMTVVSSLFFLLGLIVMLPVAFNAEAYAYRQAIGESVPAV